MDATNINNTSTASVEDRLHSQLTSFLYPQNASSETEAPASRDAVDTPAEPAQETAPPVDVDPLDEPQLATTGDFDHDKWVRDLFGGDDDDYSNIFETEPEQPNSAPQPEQENPATEVDVNDDSLFGEGPHSPVLAPEPQASPEAPDTSTRSPVQNTPVNRNHFDSPVSPVVPFQPSDAVITNADAPGYIEDAATEPPLWEPGSALDIFFAGINHNDIENAHQSMFRDGNESSPRVPIHHDNNYQPLAPHVPTPPRHAPQQRDPDDVFAPPRTQYTQTSQAPPPAGQGYGHGYPSDMPRSAAPGELRGPIGPFVAPERPLQRPRGRFSPPPPGLTFVDTTPINNRQTGATFDTTPSAVYGGHFYGAPARVDEQQTNGSSAQGFWPQGPQQPPPMHHIPNTRQPQAIHPAQNDRLRGSASQFGGVPPSFSSVSTGFRGSSAHVSNSTTNALSSATTPKDEKARKAAEKKRQIAGLRKRYANTQARQPTTAPTTPAPDRAKPGPKSASRNMLRSNISPERPILPSNALPSTNFPSMRQSGTFTSTFSTQHSGYPAQQGVVDLTGPTSPTRSQHPAGRSRKEIGAQDADEEDSWPSSNSSPALAAGKKRKASAEPKGEMAKRTKMLTDRAISAKQTMQAQLESFKRNLDTPMDAAFAMNATAAVQQITTLQAAEDFISQRSPLVKYWKLRLAPEDDDVDQIEGQVLERVRSTTLACLQQPPMAAPFAYEFREAYNHDHDNRYKNLMKKLSNEQNHLEATSKVLILIETVKRVHTKGIAMADLNDSDFKTQDDYQSEFLPDGATTRSCGKVIDQKLTCVSRLFSIAEVIKANKWIAADIMSFSSASEFMFLVCNPELYIQQKTNNWDTNHQRSLLKAAQKAGRRAAGAADRSDE